MKALSIRQPWAWLIAKGHKDVENREWAIKYRGPLLIHAAKTWDQQGCSYIKTFFTDNLPSRYSFGAIIGKVELIDCVKAHRSKWYSGPWGFVLKNAEMFPIPFPYAGKPGLFNVDFNADWHWYLRELSSNECLCGRPKAGGQSFCKTCFFKLPADMRQALYKRIGEGYEKAFETAQKCLEENVW